MSTQSPGDGHDPDPAAEPEDSSGEDGGLIATEGPRRKKRWRRALIVLLSTAVVIALVVGGVAWYLTDRYAGNIARIPDVFTPIDPKTRPAPPSVNPETDKAPITFLLAGSDSRADDATTGEGAVADAGSQRSDVIMLVQVSADRTSAFAISIPRDSWVMIPGEGMNKINAAFSYGGPTLMIQTVENLTDIRIDHYLSVDFIGFKAITDAIGGVDVRIAEETNAFGVEFAQGVNHLDGDQALAYVRQRYRLPGGDFDRVQRHQNYLRAVLAKVSRENLLTDPGELDDFLLAVTDSVSADDGLSNLDLLRLANDLRGLSQADVAFMTAPVAGTGREGAASVVYLDDAKSNQMWAYVNAGTLPQHLGEFEQLPAAPR